MSGKLNQLKWRARLLSVRAQRKLRRVLGIDPVYSVSNRVEEYRNYWEGAARLIGAEFHPLSKTYWDVRRGNAQTRINIWNVQLNDIVTSRLMVQKALCYDIAEKVGVPIPKHGVYQLHEVEKAERLMKESGGFWVVKPARDTSAGNGITTQIHTRSELRRAALLATLFAGDFLLEQMAPGESYRLLFLEGKMIHAVRRSGVRVMCDGKSTIRQLALIQGLPETILDANALWTLKSQGFSPEFIPASGHETLIRSLPADVVQTRELRTVYTESVTDIISPAILSEVGPVVNMLGANFAGVDIITVDPTVSLHQSGGVFIEANPGPGIHHHYLSEEDSRRHPVAVAVLETLLARSEAANAAPRAYKIASR